MPDRDIRTLRNLLVGINRSTSHSSPFNILTFRFVVHRLFPR
jgi:hypothetical protein